MNVLSLISSIFEPAVKLVDELHTSDEEKLNMRRRIQQIENEFLGKVLEYETKLMDNQAAIIKAEATGQSWLQRSWRPITMLTFLVLVVFDSFGILATPLADEAWLLLQIGLGGYVAGRSAEKITSQVMGARSRRDSEAKG
ncbi:3TM-type holin [Hahella ganghwensis]|uniref:3TM-type holin n=1 Tax=Hahella ganghwensis TaxID=286420 RepID=UPI00037D060E|nr:3TM-type holin [Hahella ganghwensis]